MTSPWWVGQYASQPYGIWNAQHNAWQFADQGTPGAVPIPV